MPVDDSFTKALLHFNGADASTTFTDESGKTWSASGNAQLDTAQQKFGTASLLLDGTGDYISSADHADWDLGNVWTIDFWVRFNDTTGTQVFCQQYQDGTHVTFFQKMSDNRLKMRLYNGGETGQYTTTDIPTINTNTWYHIEFVRNTNDEYIFLNGTSLALTENNAWGTNPTFTGSFYIGLSNDGGASSFLNGWMDEFRLSNGIARHTANFTPPTMEYPLATSNAFFSIL